MKFIDKQNFALLHFSSPPASTFLVCSAADDVV